MAKKEIRNNEIAAFAEDIANYYFPNSKVEPEKIAEKQRISFSYDFHLDEFDGLLVCHDSLFHIELNLFRLKVANSHRARFTFGHELGHYFIDEHRNSLLGGGSLYHVSKSEYESDLLVEVEADSFSSSLLMPRERFGKMCRKAKPGFEGILNLSRYFDVSVSATAIRYVQSEVRPSMILKWDKEGNLSWKYYSNEFYKAGFGKTFVKGRNFSRSIRHSGTDKAILGERPSNGNFFENGTTVNAWFPNALSFKNDILIEQAFPIGEYGTLTLLFTDSKGFTFSY